MLHAHTVAQVRAAEASLMARLAPGALMDRAATGLAHAIADYLGGTYGRRVLLLVGSGDNGGDALFAGARLARSGAGVEAWLLSDQVHPDGLAALRAAGGWTRDATATPPGLPGHRRPDVVVDGIVGIGGRPGLEPAAVAAMRALTGIPVVAVDVPSGVDVDTGELPTDPSGSDVTHVSADLTVTFGTHKIAHLVDPAAQACGTVHLIDIGLAPHLPAPVLRALHPSDVAELLPTPQADDHKYSRGVVGVRAGSAAYPGAARLSVAGATCGLAGMVRFVGDDEVTDAVRSDHPEVVGAGRVQSWVVGSGSDTDAIATLEDALADEVPVVVDADALAGADRARGRAAVLTPHAGELARLLDVDREEIERRRISHARAAADHFGCVVLLKGRRTLVAHPDGRITVTTTGVPWLATAGAGDVLGGVIGALLAGGLSPYDAASVGAWLHGAAATLASAGGPIVAGDVALALPAVIRAVEVEGSRA